jgi:hypothetical protein
VNYCDLFIDHIVEIYEKNERQLVEINHLLQIQKSKIEVAFEKF